MKRTLLNIILMMAIAIILPVTYTSNVDAAVSSAKVTNIKASGVPKNLTLTKGKKKAYNLTIQYKYKSKKKSSKKMSTLKKVGLSKAKVKKSYTVKSSKTSVAKVSKSGNKITITAKKAGTATITIKYQNKTVRNIKVTVKTVTKNNSNANGNSGSNNTPSNPNNSNSNSNNNNSSNNNSNNNSSTTPTEPTTPVTPPTNPNTPTPNNNTPFYSEGDAYVDVAYITDNTCIKLDATKKYNGTNDGIYIGTTKLDVFPDVNTVTSDDYHTVYVEITPYFNQVWLRPVNDGVATISFKDANNGKSYSFTVVVTGCNHEYYDYFTWRDKWIAENITPNMNDEEKVMAIKSYLVTCAYTTSGSKYTIATERRGNCTDGVNTFRDICRILGIQTWSITWWSGNSLNLNNGHAQAIVQIGNEYYRIEVSPGGGDVYEPWTNGLTSTNTYSIIDYYD